MIGVHPRSPNSIFIHHYNIHTEEHMTPPTNRCRHSPIQDEQAALLIDFGVVPKRARFFINLVILARQEGLRLYGTRRELAKKLKRIGYSIAPEAIADGRRLDFHCRVRLTRHNFHTLVEELLPPQPKE